MVCRKTTANPNLQLLLRKCSLWYLLGPLAFPMTKLDGVGGRIGWAWIVLLEGMATVVIRVSRFYMMPDPPTLPTRWLDADEIRYPEIQTVIKEGGKIVIGERTDRL